jgi:ankyrin repeat protein
MTADQILLEASSNGQTDEIRNLLRVRKFLFFTFGPRANVNAADENGETSLHHALRNGHKDIVMLLISNGADAYAAVTNKACCHGSSLRPKATRI